MKQALITMRARLMQRWQQISRREQWLVSAMGMCVLGVVVFGLVWQPTRQRLANSERQYQQQLVLQAQLQQAMPASTALAVSDRPQSLRVSESAAAARLEIEQMDAEGDTLRLSLSGDAQSLLTWLDSIEQGGGTFQSLTLEKRDSILLARVLVK